MPAGGYKEIELRNRIKTECKERFYKDMIQNNRPENMEEVMKKAEVLIEALPYIQKFNRKIIVVKYGGSAMSNE